MPARQTTIITRKKPSAEGEAMDKAFKIAVKCAERLAFAVRETIMAERYGGLVMVNKAGNVMKKVKKLDELILPVASRPYTLPWQNP